MVAVKNLVFLLATASAAVIRRDASTIEADLKTVDGDVLQLISDANSWSGSIFTVGAIDSDANQLESDLKTAGSDASAAGTLSESDASTIVAYIQSPLQGDIANAMSALTAKKSDIDNDGLDSTVASALQSIKSEADTFFSNLKAIIPSDQQSTLASSASAIDTELTNAINEFS